MQLLLPSDRTKPLLLLTGRARPNPELPTGWRSETAEHKGPFAAAVRLPGGPAAEPATLRRLAKVLLPGGHILWISDRRNHVAAVEPNGSAHDGFWRSVPLLASGSAIRSPRADWVQPLRGTGKKELLLRILGKVFGPIVCPRVRRITIMVPERSGTGGWVFELIGDLARRGIAELVPDGLGRIDRTATDMAIAQIASSSGERFALKVALSKRAAREMAEECSSLESLRRHHALSGKVLSVLPRILSSEEFSGTHYRLESWISVRPASEFMYQPRARAEAVEQAIHWVTELHRETRGPARDARADAEWARSFLCGLSERAGRKDAAFADRVAAYLQEGLIRSAVTAVHGHGDFWLGNVICERPQGPVRGVIDWKQSDSQAPPLEDVLHLLFHRKWLFSTFDPGGHLTALVQRRYGRRDRKLIVRYLKDLELDPTSAGPLVVLYWVRFLATREHTLGFHRRRYARFYSRVRNVLGGAIGPGLDQLGSWLAEA